MSSSERPGKGARSLAAIRKLREEARKARMGAGKVAALAAGLALGQPGDAPRAHGQTQDKPRWETVLKKETKKPDKIEEFSRAREILEYLDRRHSQVSILDHTYGYEQPPQGFRTMCEGLSKACLAQDKSPRELVKKYELSRDNPAEIEAFVRELEKVNAWVNQNIKQISDREAYGTEEFWAEGCKPGDCEDLAACKRHLILKKGAKPEHLVFVVLRQQDGQRHAALVYRTTLADFILDNRFDEVRIAEYLAEMGDVYMLRQSPIDPQLWLSLNPHNRRK